MGEETQKKEAPTEPRAEIPSRRKKVPLLLRILLDTNQLFTGSASDLLRQALKKIIEDSRAHTDIQIEWFIPEIVRWEREYQMRAASLELLPSLAKLERLLGHNLGVSEEILASRVRDAIEKQISELGIKVIPLNIGDVDWNKIVLAAVFREPPFERGEKEKGFRDAVIAECLMQLIVQSPKHPSSCRIALVTADGLLGQVMETRTANSQNVRVLRNLDDLQSLINTLVSNVTEEFVAGVREVAHLYFFSEGSKEGLYYKEQITERISKQYGEKLGEFPKGASFRENGTWYIGAPSFVEKNGQRITWRTSIKIDANAFKLETRESATLNITTVAPGDVVSGALPQNPYLMPNLSNIYRDRGEQLRGYGLEAALSGLTSGHVETLRAALQNKLVLPQTEKVLLTKGHTLFHVTWSVTITATGKLTHPKIDSIQWKETVWQ